MRAFPASCSARIASLTGSTVIVSVLAAFDGKELPSLPMDITLNTFLAFFTTIVRVAITGPVAECISQWKWNWFHHERPLADFQIFDRASRGILGSVLLIKLLKWKYVSNFSFSSWPRCHQLLLTSSDSSP